MSSGDLDGKHVIVTGGAGGLGRAVVRRLAGEGAICHIPTYDAEASPGAIGLAEEADRVRLAAGVDLTSEASARAFFDGVPAPAASVHAAGGFAMAGVLDTGLEDFEAMHRQNAVTCFLSCREAIRNMRGAGGGRIVNVAARPAAWPAGGLVAYTTSKAAVASMTQCLADEVSGDGILINAVMPSIIDTPPNRSAMPAADHDRWPKPEQIAEAIAFLASPRNELTSGALVPVYGRA